MMAATAVVVLITAMAPVLGAYLAGLVSPLPVFGAVLAAFTHRAEGPADAILVLDGFLAAPAVFFVVLALTLPAVGLLAFAAAAGGALATQALTMLAIPRSRWGAFT